MEITASPVLPQLPPDEYRVIRDSIAEIGVQVPLLLTADHVLVDGHERWRAIQELEITKFPMRVVGCLTEAERVQLAIKLNLERRHLSVAQRRELAARLLREDACQTDRKVASAVGCDHKTVGKVRSDLAQLGKSPVARRPSEGTARDTAESPRSGWKPRLPPERRRESFAGSARMPLMAVRRSEFFENLMFANVGRKNSTNHLL